MAAIRSKNTKPELQVRSRLHRAGLRYILHDRRLSGKPDLVFPKHRTVVFIHGCFWHGHKKCHRSKSTRIPKTRVDYWKEKIERNIKRDTEHMKALQKQGWRVLLVWECGISERAVGSLIKNIRATRSTKKLTATG